MVALEEQHLGQLRYCNVSKKWEHTFYLSDLREPISYWSRILYSGKRRQRDSVFYLQSRVLEATRKDIKKLHTHRRIYNAIYAALYGPVIK